MGTESSPAPEPKSSITLTVVGVLAALVVAIPILIYMLANFRGKGVFALPLMVGIAVYSGVRYAGAPLLGLQAKEIPRERYRRTPTKLRPAP